MLKFSASRGEKGNKQFYKNFFEESEEMENMGHYLRKYAISSYLYGSGETETDPPEKCEGHKAWRSVVGQGNILLFDFDSKVVPVTFEMIANKLRGVSSYIAPSRSWSETLEKYHVVVELSEDVPKTREAFKTLYRAAAQRLGFEGLYDATMESATQQMSPHGLKEALELHIKGSPLDVVDVLAKFEAIEGQASGKTYGGAVDSDAMFTLSRTGETIGVTEMMARVDAHGKQRVHCLAGLDHDGRSDTAFVNASEGGYIYACSGGRCQHTLSLEVNPFVPQLSDMVIEKKTETLRDIIMAHPRASSVYSKEKPEVGDYEAALNYGLGVVREREGVSEVEGTLRVFNGVYWEQVFKHKSELYQYIQDSTIEAGFFNRAYSNNALNSAFAVYKNLVPVREHGDIGNYLNLSNCVLEISKGGIQQHPHDSDYLFTYKLPYDYDPKAKAPVWEMIVDRVMCSDKDTKEAFQQALGYLLLREFNLEKMVCFVGEGENGKSTILRVLKKLVSRAGYSAQPIKTLVRSGNDAEYAKAQLAGKLINFTNELTPSSLEADAFKDLISGEDITARNIYASPFILATVPKQVVAMNTTDMLIKERTHGFMRRLLLIPFNYTLKDEHKDKRLDEKLDAEMSGILNWVLAGARAVMASGKIKESLAMRRMFDDVKRDANPAQQFVEEQLEVTQEIEYDSEVKTGVELYEKYRQFCEENRYLALGRNKFLKELRRLGVQKIDTSRSMEGRPARRLKGFLCSWVQEEGVKVGFTQL